MDPQPRSGAHSAWGPILASLWIALLAINVLVPAGAPPVPTTPSTPASLEVRGPSPVVSHLPLAPEMALPTARGSPSVAPFAPRGTPQWNLTCTPCTVSGRQYASMAWDPKDGYDVMFGGLVSPTDNQPGDTWTYVGGVWTNITATACPSGCPSPRFGSAMTYDAADGYVLLYGGANYWASSASGFLSDTWSFSGGVWTPLTPGCSPSCPIGRYQASMAYDAADGYVLMFGGAGITWPGGVPLDDSWEYLAGTWTLISASGGPSSREGAGMTYDAADGYVVLYGGVGGTSLPPTQVNSQTWTYSGAASNGASNWLEVSSSSTPGNLADINQMMVYDSSLGQVLLFGGATDVSPFDCTDATWTYSAGTWSAPAVGGTLPSGRLGSVLANDPADGTAVLFSGWPCSVTSPNPDDTWTYYSGSAPLTAGLTATPKATDLGYPVTFGITAYGGWPNTLTITLGYGNGVKITPTGSSATYTYPVAGNYTAWLWVNDSAGASASAFVMVTINPLPTVVGSGSPNPADVGVSVAFHAAVAGGTAPFTYAWIFGDGTGSIATSPTHAYAAAGTSTVHLWANDSLGKSAAASFSETIDTLPTLKASPTSAASDVGIAVHFTASSTGGAPPTVLTWRFGDGSSGTGSPAPHAYAARGNYTARVWANDTAGGSVALAIPVVIAPDLNITSLIVSANPADANESVRFTAAVWGGNPGLNTSWNFGDGATGKGDPATYAYPAPGTYTIRCWVNDSVGGSISSSRRILVGAALSLTSFTGSFAPGAPGQLDLGQTLNTTAVTKGGLAPLAYDYTRIPTGCKSADTAHWSCRANQTGAYALNLTVTDAAGATTSATLDLTVNPRPTIASFTLAAPQVSVGASDDLITSVAGGTAPLTLSYGGLPSGCSSQNLTTLPCSPSSAGSFDLSVEVTDAEGFSASGAAALTVNPDPTIQDFHTNPSSAVVGQSLAFAVVATGGTGNLTYAYVGLPPGCPASALGPAGGTCTPTGTGTFHVVLTVTDADHREANATVTLTVGPAPLSLLQWLSNEPWVWLVLLVVAGAVLIFLLDRRQRRRRRTRAEPEVAAAVGPDEVAPDAVHPLSADVTSDDIPDPLKVPDPGPAPAGYAPEPSVPSPPSASVVPSSPAVPTAPDPSAAPPAEPATGSPLATTPTSPSATRWVAVPLSSAASSDAGTSPVPSPSSASPGSLPLTAVCGICGRGLGPDRYCSACQTHWT